VFEGEMRVAVFVAMAAAALLGAGGQTPNPSEPPDVADTLRQGDQLERVRVRGLQTVYARRGASLAAYDSVLLDPIEVSFHKNWDRMRVAGVSINAEEKLEIRNGLARILRDEFVASLAKGDRYRVVDKPGETVLRIKAQIKDLYINAPDLPRAANVRTYTLSLGEMTLSAELFDSVTGDLIARVTDRKKDPESVWLELTTSVDNIAAARTVARSWAKVLTEQLDLAHREVSIN
jgi:hypothetical protein